MLKAIFNKFKVIIVILFLCYAIVMIFSSVHLPSLSSRDEIKKDVQIFKPFVNEVKQLVKPIPGIPNDTPNVEELKWTELTPYLYVMKAYLDLRKDDEIYVRFLTIIKRNNDVQINLECKYNGSSEYHNAVSYQFNENHGMEFGGYIHSCKIPANLIHIREVILRDKASGIYSSLPLKVINVFQVSKQKFNFTICIPPLFGDIDSSKLIAFIEMNRILGAQHFYFYNFSIQSPSFAKVINYYNVRGLLTLFKWNIPSNNIWYNGQMSAIHHCLYENIGISHYTIFQDLDELLTPIKVRTWSLLMQRIDNKKHAGYKIPMAFITPVTGPYMYIESKERSVHIDHLRSKCIVLPHLIFEQGIHHISKQNVEEFTPKEVDSSEVLLLHFKECTAMFGFICAGTQSEKRLSIYKEQFLESYNSVII